ncbi:MAG: AAA family ATPase [Rubrivivax sp.]|nr:AAA family ATPase [Rubrivivax sp.]
MTDGPTHSHWDAVPELDPGMQAGMVRALRDALQATLIETHISWVLVAGGQAYKFKKAMSTAFLDQSTRELRLRACKEELRLNRRLAPELYESVVAVTGSTSAPLLGGSGPVIDHAVRMRSFDQDGLWERRAEQGTLTAADVDSLVALLVEFHERCERVDPASLFGTSAAVRHTVLQNLQELEQAGLAELLTTEDRDRLRTWEEEAFAKAHHRIDERRTRGHVRECHGDLHLGNVTLFEGRTTVFDGIEFSPALRWTDVMADLAFMAMDLQAHGLSPLANRLLNAYVEASGDHDGLPVLDYLLVHRALVRAKVALLRARQQGQRDEPAAMAAARRYLGLALQLTAAPAPQLIITHGCSGSGKSTVTQRLLEELGAVRLRSDVERRRLEHLADVARYSDAANEATYARLVLLAERLLKDGHPVILDATFLRSASRQVAWQLAKKLQVPFAILDFVNGAELDLMRRRLIERAARGGDASEADIAVLEDQLKRIEPLQAEEMVVVRPAWPQR